MISHRSLYYCPTGSAMPLIAEPGYYTTNDAIVSENENESYGVSFFGSSIVGSSIASEIRRTNVSLCEFGHTCNLGVRNACPGGTFGNRLVKRLRQVVVFACSFCSLCFPSLLLCFALLPLQLPLTPLWFYLFPSYSYSYFYSYSYSVATLSTAQPKPTYLCTPAWV